MIDCPECGAPQLEGTLFCSECGGSFINKQKATNVLPFSEFTYRASPHPLEDHVLTPYQEPTQITVIIPSSRRRLTLSLVEQIQIGRSDPDSGYHPELDLSLDQGIEKGVSRKHAILESSQQGVVLIDLDSTNGTTLNNHKLPAQKPFLLQDGDEIRFGDLLVHIFLA